MSSQTIEHTQHVVIIGGGISGLSTAWYLQKAAKENNTPITYTLLEKNNRWGGKVLTETVDDVTDLPFVVEAGPDSFLAQKPWALQLARELGLEDELLGTNDTKRNVYVLSKGRPVVLPDGVLMIVPTKFMPFVTSPLISLLGKLRMGLDLFIPAKKGDDDETLGDFIRRRLGKEALDKIAEPLMSGIYNADADRQSMLATFPRFRMIEKQHRSLTLGMLASKRQRAGSQPPAGQKKMSAFVSLQTGTEKLIKTLAEQLDGDIRLNTGVSNIQKHGEQYQITLHNDDTIQADAVVLTTPAYITADLLGDVAPQSIEGLKQIRYVSTGTISFAFKTSDIKKPLDGFGVVIPSSENRPINAITISSTKFNKRAPEGYVLMRAFFGGSRSPESMNLSDEDLIATIRQELASILGITAEPLFHRIYRWWNGNPQYDLGHLERVDAIERSLPDGIYVTGSPYRGVGMPDCVHQSQQTVNKLTQNLQ